MNIKLDAAGTRRMIQGHPWVLLEHLGRFSTAPAPGTLVRLQDRLGNFLGHGVAEGPASPIAYRVLARERHPSFDQPFFSGRIARALEHRGSVLEPKALQRLIHGEADQLPGVFCDRMGSTLLLEFSSPAMLPFEPLIVASLKEKPGWASLWRRLPNGPWEKAAGTRAKPPATAERGGMHFHLRLERPAEPFDLDPSQSGRWAQLREAARGRSVLVAFNRRGAWATALALGGAEKVLCLERDAEANSCFRENLALNKISQDRVELDAGDAFQSLDRLPPRRFGVLVVDSPVESKSGHGRYLALKNLPALASRAFKLAEPGASVFFGLRRDILSEATFLGCLKQGAQDAGVHWDALPTPAPAPDFPELEAFPEGHGGLWFSCLVKRT